MSLQYSNEAPDLTNAVWDDDEWISWDEINRYVEHEANKANKADARGLHNVPSAAEGLESDERPQVESSPEIWDRLMKLIRQAQAAVEKGENVGSQIGEMGELFAEAKFGIKRHRQYAQGSDGKLGNDFVEVKTISPWKKKSAVRVKRAGHWSRLVVVRICARWIFEAKSFDRKQFGKGKGGKHLLVSWNADKPTSRQQHDKTKLLSAIEARP